MTEHGLSRLCPTCQVATLEDSCWICGGDVNQQDYKGRVSIPNPTGPNSDALGEGLYL